MNTEQLVSIIERIVITMNLVIVTNLPPVEIAASNAAVCVSLLLFTRCARAIGLRYT